jgi:hypothetical protein
LSGTLFGGIADRIAYQTAERRRPAAEAIARDRLAERVYPEFDNEIDNQLANANIQLDSSVRQKLRQFNLMPSRQHVSSTDTRMNYSMQIGDESAMSSTIGLESESSADCVSILVHESLLNLLLANSGLKGLKTTDRQIMDFFAPYEVKELNPEPAKPNDDLPLPPGMDNVITDVEFDEVNPLTVRIDNGKMFLTMRAKFKPMGKEVVPPLSVTAQYDTQLAGDKIIVIPSNIKVELQEKENGDDEPGVALKLVTRAIESSFTKLAFDRVLPAKYWTYGGTLPSVTAIRSRDGWAAISVN